MTASGSVGDTLTLLRQFGRNIAKRKSKPTGAPSAAQLAHRALYRNAVNTWNQLTDQEKASYASAANAARYNPFNAFLAVALKQTATTWDAGTTTWDADATTWDS
jgi:hypothetical protein